MCVWGGAAAAAVSDCWWWSMASEGTCGVDGKCRIQTGGAGIGWEGGGAKGRRIERMTGWPQFEETLEAVHAHVTAGWETAGKRRAR